jgi:hypothetical protein
MDEKKIEEVADTVDDIPASVEEIQENEPHGDNRTTLKKIEHRLEDISGTLDDIEDNLKE